MSGPRYRPASASRPTKTLAKLANRVAKKDPAQGGVADLRDERLRRDAMERFPVADVWGVGRATAAKLAGLGVATAAELAALPMKQARMLGTVVLERLERRRATVCQDGSHARWPHRRSVTARAASIK